MEEKIKIVSFNIRCLYYGDGVNSFIHRAGMILDKIKKEKPDIICFQEVTDGIRVFLTDHLNDYVVVGHGRDADCKGEGISIAYRRETVELFSLDHFWLSATPDVPGSVCEIPDCMPRICACAELYIKKAAESVRIYGVHLDYCSEEAQLLEIKRIIARITADNERQAHRTFVLGDFNAEPDSKCIRYCYENDILPMVDAVEGSGYTFHNFGLTPEADGTNIKIDYIFTDPETVKKVTASGIWDDCVNGIYLSDHYPLFCEIEI